MNPPSASFLQPQSCGKCNLSQEPKLLYCRECGDPLAIGKEAGRFRILRRIAAGGMSVIYIGQDPQTKDTAAIKVLNQQNAMSSEICKRFLREAETLAVLQHPKIVQFLGVGDLAGLGPYMALEYLQGQPLSSLLTKERPFPLRRLFPMLEQICEALTFAHGQGVVHRDLKPENLFLLPSPKGDLVKVFDFGIAKIRHGAALTEPGKILGTPYYMSPEQVMGRPIDHRADLYSLGVLLFELVTGFLPFQGRTPMEILSLRLFQEAPLVSQKRPALAGSQLESLIAACLKREPAERPASAHEIAQGFAEAREADAMILAILQDAEDAEALDIESTQQLSKPEQEALVHVFSQKRSQREIEMVETFDGSSPSPFARPESPAPLISPFASSSPKDRSLASSSTLSILPPVPFDPKKKETP